MFANLLAEILILTTVFDILRMVNDVAVPEPVSLSVAGVLLLLIGIAGRRATRS